MKELEVEIRLRNNLLKERRLEAGYSQTRIAQLIGISAGEYNRLERMQLSPLGSHGQWRSVVRKVAQFYGVQPAELFPKAIVDLKANKVTRKLDIAELAVLGVNCSEPPKLPDAAIDLKRRQQAIETTLKTLTPQEERVIRRRFGFDDSVEEKATLREIGQQLGVGPERTRQIENMALHKLRHDSRAMRLRPFVDMTELGDEVYLPSEDEDS